MKRESRQRTEPKPVQKVEINEKHVKLRIVLFVVFALIAVGALVFGLVQCLSVDSGWYEISANNSSDSCAAEFTFTYYLDGDMGRSGKNKLESAYSELCESAYKQFHASALFDGVNNLARIGFDRNGDVTVSTELYAALKLLSDGGNRYVYRAPIYSIYRNLFTCLDDDSAREFDPYYNDVLLGDIEQLSKFVETDEHIKLEFIENNTVRLYISDEYYSYATEHGYSVFLDTFALENAFMIDYVADGLIASGYTHGMIASRDGFARDLDTSNVTDCSIATVFDRESVSLYVAAHLKFKTAAAVVSFCDRARNAPFGHYYMYSDGVCRTPYIGADYLNVAATSDLVTYSYEKNCAQIAVVAIRSYCAEQLNSVELAELKASGVYSSYCNDNVVYYNDNTIGITVYSYDNRVYNAQYIE